LFVKFAVHDFLFAEGGFETRILIGRIPSLVQSTNPTRQYGKASGIEYYL